MPPVGWFRLRPRTIKYTAMVLIDIHTHNSESDPETAILNCPPYDTGRRFSAGIHPCEITSDWKERLHKIEELLCSHNGVAVGECGIDKLKSMADIHLQKEVFLAHALLAERVHLPLIIHCVKAYDEILAIRKECRPTQAWIIHGFRGKPQLTEQLIKAGFYISLGERFNPESARAIPSNRLLVESDESTLPILEIYSRVAAAKETGIEQLAAQTYSNAQAIGLF